jgi:putative flippase GtrA
VARKRQPNIGVPSGTAQHKEAVINPPDRFGIGIKRAAVISPKVLRFLRYTGVNLASTAVDYAFFLTLTHFFGMPIMQSIIAYSVALMVNFTLTRTYVFVGDMSHKSEHRVFVEFVGTGLIGLVLTAAVVWFTIHVLGLSPVDAKTISVLICFVVLYFVRSRIVFNENAASPAVA